MEEDTHRLLYNTVDVDAKEKQLLSVPIFTRTFI
jgi:hypothetical protein